MATAGITMTAVVSFGLRAGRRLQDPVEKRA
jgi:hypothetical protein